MSDFYWHIDNAYRDAQERPGDEFASKVRIDKEQMWGIANSGGIRVLKGGDNGIKNNSKTAALFCITNSSSSSFHNPWDDIIDPLNGTIYYWGDAKSHDIKKRDDWPGNKRLINVYQQVLDGNYSDVPPILFFEKPKSGKMIFKGLCAIESYEPTWFMDGESRVSNYRFKFA